MEISNPLMLLQKIAALRLRPGRSLHSRGGPLPWIPNGQSTSWATLSTRDARGAGSGMYAAVRRSGAFSVAMTVIYGLIRDSLKNYGICRVELVRYSIMSSES